MGIPLEFLSQFCEKCADLLYYKTSMFPCTIYTNLTLAGLNRACITDVYIYKLLENLTIIIMFISMEFYYSRPNTGIHCTQHMLNRFLSQLIHISRTCRKKRFDRQYCNVKIKAINSFTIKDLDLQNAAFNPGSLISIVRSFSYNNVVWVPKT